MLGGLGCSCALSVQAGSVLAQAGNRDSTVNNPLETPCEEKVDFTKQWIKRFMDILDENLENETRKNIMMMNGRECAKSAYGEVSNVTKSLSYEEIDSGIAEWQKVIGKENIYREGDLIFFSYVRNPLPHGRGRPGNPVGNLLLLLCRIRTIYVLCVFWNGCSGRTPRVPSDRR